MLLKNDIPFLNLFILKISKRNNVSINIANNNIIGLLQSKLKIITNKNKETIIDITYKITEIANATNVTIEEYENLYFVM
ncbi:MAG: hypothetical protein J6D03_11180 [Clostridia bacterium]|nr:hypothetical protein [Clostridia bacterium]